MIVASFHNDHGRLSLKLSGHAGMAEAGRDIVCASASILAYTVAQEVQNMENRHQLAEPPIIRMDAGDAEITIKPVDEATYDALHTFYIAQVGYSLLAYNYPQYVELIIELSETDTRS